MENRTGSFDNLTVAVFNTTDWNFTTTANQSEEAGYIQPSIVELYVTPTISAIGMIGNSLSFIVLLQLSNESCFYLYLAALALADFVALLFGGIIRWLNTIGIVKLFSSLAFSYCNPFFGFVVMAGHFSSWITVSVSVDRYIAVCHPFKVATYCTRRRTIITLTSTFLVIVLINFPMICFDWDDDSSCLFTLDFCMAYLTNLDPPFHVHVPIIFILVINTLIVRKLIITAKTRQTLSNSNTTNHTNDSTRRTVVLLLAISSLFVLTFLPLIVVTAYILIADMDIVVMTETFPLAFHVIDMACFSKHALNFLLFGFSGKTFRDKLTNLLRSCVIKR